MAVAASERTVRRLVEHRRRVEQPAHPRGAPAIAARRVASETAEAAGTAGVDPLTGWALPVARHLRPAAGAEADPPATSTSARPVSEPAAPPPVDVERLADQVVRQIDRRIVAHRERVGRI